MLDNQDWMLYLSFTIEMQYTFRGETKMEFMAALHTKEYAEEVAAANMKYETEGWEYIAKAINPNDPNTLYRVHVYGPEGFEEGII